MKKSDPRKIKSLVEAKTDQSKVLYFPENWRSAYSAYTALYSGGLLKSSHKRASATEIAKHVFLIMLWIGALTTFFALQRTAHEHTVAPGNKTVEARLMQPAKSPL